ncbi:hypothetical protein O6P43_026403 [Quillaja saponaria]|uniref:Uncharacterized protein n=1 Tax=Quillaja saponaria TaxID=32244 RepID=A0AAD7L217_QUISA|nr:hypothetical protein O6P43_026403 [Quillaja saponaria]
MLPLLKREDTKIFYGVGYYAHVFQNSVRKFQHRYGFGFLNRIFQPGHPLVLDFVYLTSGTIATRKSQSGREQIYAKLSKENFLNQGNMVAMGLRACEVMRSSILFFRINFLANGFEFVGCRFF